MKTLRGAITKLLRVDIVDFSDAFSAAIAGAGFSQNRAGPALGCTGPFVNQVIRRKAKPPLDQIERWADALHLEGDARAEFIRLAYLAHAPEQVRQLVEAQAEMIAKLTARVEALEARGDPRR